MRTLVLFVAGAACTAASAAAQPAPSPPDPAVWSGDASVFTYVVPDDGNYAQPTLRLDRGALHLEGRLNYEDLDTGSAWVGWTFGVGGQVRLEITPIGGMVFGNTWGGAVGYSGSVEWRALDLSSESEYVFPGGDGERFLYTWSEIGWSPLAWLRAGVAIQRTKVYRTEFDIQRGFFGAVAWRRWELSAYVFNPDADPTVVVGAGFGF